MVKTIKHTDYIFVYGSNDKGLNGKGAALTGKKFYGAVDGIGEGISGRCYAIPTKDQDLNVKTLSEINESIGRFIEYAKDNSNDQFMLTRIGCGLAGYQDKEIISLLKKYELPKNIHVPGIWFSQLLKTKKPKIIIAGGRDFFDYDFLMAKCNRVLSSLLNDEVEIISGGCKGADQMGEQYFYDELKIKGHKLTRIPAMWDEFSKSAGPLRNSAMAWYGTHLIAFWDGKSAGTKDMISKAKEGGLSVRVIHY